MSQQTINELVNLAIQYDSPALAQVRAPPPPPLHVAALVCLQNACQSVTADFSTLSLPCV